MIERADLQNLIKKVFCLLAGIQIILGLVWLTGRLVERPLSLLTVFVAWKAYAYFLRHVTELFRRDTKPWSLYLWAAYLVTFPIILHCHADEWLYSLGSTFILLLLADLIRLNRTEENSKYCILRIAGEWLGACLFVPTYGAVAAVVVLPVLLLLGWRKRIRLVAVLLITLMAVSGMSAGHYASRKQEEKACIQSSISSVLLSRFAWPYFMRNSYFWGEEVRQLFSDAELVHISTYPELVRYEFGPKLEAATGKARAREIYRRMAWDSLKIGKKDAVKDFGRDLFANAGGPLAVQYQLSGGGVSYTGKNYTDMRAKMPELTRYYVRFAFWGFDFMAFFALAVSAIRIFKKKLRMQRHKVFYILGISSIMVFWYTMIGNGMQDYLKVIPISILWCLLPVLGYGLLNDDREKLPNNEER